MIKKRRKSVSEKEEEKIPSLQEKKIDNDKKSKLPPILRENFSDSSLGSDFEDINNPSKKKISGAKSK